MLMDKEEKLFCVFSGLAILVIMFCAGFIIGGASGRTELGEKENLIETDVKTLIEVLKEYPADTKIIIKDIKIPENNLGENVRFEKLKITEL